MDLAESTRRRALEMALQHGERPLRTILEHAREYFRYLNGEQAPETFTIGERTMAAVFKPNGITELSNLQRVLDAVEAALQPQPVGPYQVNVGALGTAVVLADVSKERQLQVARGYGNSHDDQHDAQEIAVEAAWGILPAGYVVTDFGVGWIKRGDRRRELVQGIALAIAEVERLDRMPQPAVPRYDAPAPAYDPEQRTHGDSSAIDDARPLPTRAAAGARPLTIRDLPMIAQHVQQSMDSSRSTPNARR